VSQENIALAQRALVALNQRDWDGFLAFADDDVTSESRLASIEGGYHGHSGLRRWWENLLSTFPDHTVEIIHMRDQEDMTLAHLRATGHSASSRTPLIDDFWYLARWRDGKVVWWRATSTEADALKAVGLEDRPPTAT
jgi:ketosteroid isomerase-like protein